MAPPHTLFDMTDRTAVVTGASSGLGVVFAEALAEAGANVVVAARRVSRLEEVAARITSAGGAALAVECDVTDAESTAALMDAAVARFGGLDVVVANAGVVAEGGTVPEKMPPDLFEQSLRVNVVGTFNTCQAAARHMLPAGRGIMVTLASVAGMGAHYEVPGAYGSAKAAIINLTQHLALRWGDRGIRVNALAPGWFPSEMTDVVIGIPAFNQRLRDQTALDRLGDPKELVGPLLLLCSEAGSFMTGTTLVVDGGASCSLGEAPFPDALYDAFAANVPGGLAERIMPDDR